MLGTLLQLNKACVCISYEHHRHHHHYYYCYYYSSQKTVTNWLGSNGMIEGAWAWYPNRPKFKSQPWWLLSWEGLGKLLNCVESLLLHPWSGTSNPYLSVIVLDDIGHMVLETGGVPQVVVTLPLSQDQFCCAHQSLEIHPPNSDAVTTLHQCYAACWRYTDKRTQTSGGSQSHLGPVLFPVSYVKL